MIYHNQQEKELLQYSQYLSTKDKAYAIIQFACLLGAGVASLTLMAAAYLGV